MESMVPERSLDGGWPGERSSSDEGEALTARGRWTVLDSQSKEDGSAMMVVRCFSDHGWLLGGSSSDRRLLDISSGHG